MSNPSHPSHGPDAARPSQVPTLPSGNIAINSYDVPISEPIHAATAATIGVPRPQDIECPEYANRFYVITRGLAVGIFFSWNEAQVKAPMNTMPDARWERITTFAQALQLYTEMYHDGEVEVVDNQRVIFRSPRRDRGTHPITIPAPADFEDPGYTDKYYVISRGFSVGIFFSWNRAKFRITGVPNARVEKVDTFTRALQLYTKIYDDGDVVVVREGRIVARSPCNLAQSRPSALGTPCHDARRRVDQTGAPASAPQIQHTASVPITPRRRTEVLNERSCRQGTPTHTRVNTTVGIRGTGHIVVINTPGSAPSHSAGSAPSHSGPPVSINISVTRPPIPIVVISDDEGDFELQNQPSRVHPRRQPIRRRPISISSDEEDSSHVDGASGSEVEPMNSHFARNCAV